MLKIKKKDFPWIVIIEDKISDNTGKKYQKISVGYIGKNPNATCEADKYLTKWLDFFNEQDLLKAASTFENAYQRLKYERDKEREQENKKSNTVIQETSETAEAYPDLNDDFDL